MLAIGEKLVIGCVAENTPKYLGQALRLIQSIRWFGGDLNKAELYVCVVDAIRQDFREEIERYGAKVRIVPRFNTKHPQSNKLRFLELPDLVEYDRVLLLDCDITVVRDPSPHLFDAEFAAKIADVATVSLDTFRHLFAAFDLSLPETSQKCTVRGELTIPYFNAGMLAFSRRAMNTLVPNWIEHNKQLIERMDLLRTDKNFCEQASLSLAIAATGVPFKIVGNALNFPMHFDDPSAAPGLVNIDPYIIHYHWLVDPSGNILPSSYPLVNARINEFNARLRQERELRFNNRLFWNQRYSENPDLGSGIGSRGDSRIYKRRLLEDFAIQLRPRSVLDVGCGDAEVSSGLPAEGYTGLDFSEVIVASNREKFRDRTFVAGNFLEIDIGPAEMVVCLDVLIHLSSPEEYRSFVHKLVRSTLKKGIVAGDETDPNLGGIVFFHEPLSRTLAEAGATNIRVIGAYRHVTIFEFGPPPPERRNALIVLGMHRSGTSALAGLIGQLGGDVGSTLMPIIEEINAKGFWEHAEIVNIHERLLTMLDSSWDDVRPLPDRWWMSSDVDVFKAMILTVLRRDFACSPLWIVKDPRLCRLLPLWLEIFRDFGSKPHFILTLRHPMEVARSLRKRDNFLDEQSSLLWLDHVLQAEKWSRGYPRTFVAYDDLLSNWHAEVLRISSELSLPLKFDNDEMLKKASSFIDPKLRHHFDSEHVNVEPNRVIALAVQCYQMLRGSAASKDMTSELDGMLLEVTEIAGLVACWDRKNRALNATLSQLEAEIRRVKNTRSWRFTKLFRFAYNKLHR